MIQFDSFMQVEGVPIYQQIIRYVKQGIAAGTIRDGEELPSRRVLSALLAVNPNTVQKAYRMMEEEGLVESHTGAKSCVHADAGRVAALRQELTETELLDQGIKPNTIRLSIGTEHIDDILADLQRGFDAVKEE